MEKKLFLVVLIALFVFLIGATLIVEDRFIDLVNRIIPDGTIVSVYLEKSSL